MIKYKGTTLYPPALYNILDNISEVQEYVVEVFTNPMGTDEIQINLASANQNGLEEMIKERMRSKLRVAPTLNFQDIAEIRKQKYPKLSRKPIKFIDKR